MSTGSGREGGARQWPAEDRSGRDSTGAIFNPCSCTSFLRSCAAVIFSCSSVLARFAGAGDSLSSRTALLHRIRNCPTRFSKGRQRTSFDSFVEKRQDGHDLLLVVFWMTLT